jgi:hypothetical protein
MIAFLALDRTALLAAELARRMPRSEAQLWRRLESLLSPLTKEEVDVIPSVRREIANTLWWMQVRGYVRPSDDLYRSLATFSDKRRPWWDPVAPYLYRPNQTANWFAAQCRIFLPVGERPSTEFFEAFKAASEQARALDPGPVAKVIFNPAGWRHPVIDGCDQYTDYIARAYAQAGVQTLSLLVVKLRAGGISNPTEVAAALAGSLGQAHADPFSGKPMHFDPSSNTVGFEVETKHLSGSARPQRERYGRMALRL